MTGLDTSDNSTCHFGATSRPSGPAPRRHFLTRIFARKTAESKKKNKIFQGCFFFRMRPPSLQGLFSGWHAPPARGVATTGKPPPKKKIDKPNEHYRHLIHELWGNPQNSWRSSTLFLFFLLLFTCHPFTFCDLTGHRCFGAGRRGRRSNQVSMFHAPAPTNTHAHTQQQ